MPNDFYTHVEAGVERDKVHQKIDKHISDAGRLERLLRVLSTKDYQEYLAMRSAKDQELLALAGDDLFNAGRCVGRADVIMELRADIETVKLQLQRAISKADKLRPQPTV